MTQDTEDVVARLRVQARHEETASKMMADAKTARQTDREDAWTDAGYSWTTAEQTASWRAADLIQSLFDRIDVLREAREELHDLIWEAGKTAEPIEGHPVEDRVHRNVFSYGKDMATAAIVDAVEALMDAAFTRAALHQEGIATGEDR